MWNDIVGVLLTVVVFILPFYFLLVNAGKNEEDSFRLNLSPPKDWQLLENFKTVITDNDYMVLRSTWNSLVMTLGSVFFLIIISGMTGYVMHRKRNIVTTIGNIFVLTALVVPPAIVPTIWVLQRLGLYKTMTGMIMIQVAYGLAFAVLIFRNFMSTIPREIDEAAMIDGCTGWGLYFRVIFPLLKPVTITIGIIATAAIFNDFTNPLYYLPGEENATLQQTLFNYVSRYSTQYNLLFTDILYITAFPLVAFIFFNKRIVAGMTAGSIKG
ncbi:MAG: ABC transporter permease subunit [Actinobacteria bacterium]|nr:ABC transporter permease subunit [Actinomycetota bacterium]